MMGKRFLVLISIIVPMICSGQRTDETIYYTWVNTIGRTSTPKGYIMQFQDDHVYQIKKFKYNWDDPRNNNVKRFIPVEVIQSISIRKKDSVSKGAWKGTLIGGTAAGIIMVVINNNTSTNSMYNGGLKLNNEVAFGVGFLLGTIPGAITGAICGTKKTHFYIGGSQTSYQEQKEKLKRLLFEQ